MRGDPAPPPLRIENSKTLKKIINFLKIRTSIFRAFGGNIFARLKSKNSPRSLKSKFIKKRQTEKPMSRAKKDAAKKRLKKGEIRS